MTKSVRVKIAMMLFVLFSILTAQTPQKRVLAVNELYFSAISSSDAARITESLIYNIKGLNVYSLMERYDMKTILDQTGYQQTSICTRPSCALEIGQLLSVDLVAIGSISQIGTTYSIGINIIDIRTGRTVKEVNDFYKGDLNKLLNQGLPVIASKLCGITPEMMVVKRNRISPWYWILGGIIAVTIPLIIILTNQD
ncbi:MAG: hypothetical protein Q4F84_03890 [Fibrobacter sp.]|nr:hypothetical protein [Fibrobacter sp.]